MERGCNQVERQTLEKPLFFSSPWAQAALARDCGKDGDSVVDGTARL